MKFRKLTKVAEVYRTSKGHYYEHNLHNGKWYIYRGSFSETDFQAELEAAYQRQLEPQATQPKKTGSLVGGHIYDMDGDHRCINGCGCWMGDTRSGGPEGVDPFGECPRANGSEIAELKKKKGGA